MMRNICSALVAVVLFSGSVYAQDQDLQQRRLLQRQVVERLFQNVRMQAGLDREQFDRYREIARRSIAERNEIQSHERQLWRSLEDQMRPGVAANEDSVVALIDSLSAVPERRVRAMRAEQREYADFLTPVQRAQLLLIHRRFEANVRRIMQRRLPNRPIRENGQR